MTRYDRYQTGVPSWVDLGSPDPQASRDFYAGLFRWTYELGSESTGFYAQAFVDGAKVAGIGSLAEGGHPAWTTYVDVADADAFVAAATAAGGKAIVPAMTVAEGDDVMGRMAIVADPTGAVVGVWQAGSHAGAALANVPGAATWNELATPDAPAAREFYSDVFGWEHEQIGDGQTFDYTLAQVDGRGIGGIMGMVGDAWTGIPPHWAVYFAVDDTDAALTRAVEHGGTVLEPARDTPQGRVAMIADPHGAVLRVISLVPGQAPD